VLADGKITELLTVQEQAGFQMILSILDEDHVELLKNAPSNAPYWVNIGK
jgi:dihydroxyacetone kinase-like protein